MSLGRHVQGVESLLSRIKEMQNKLESGKGCQVDAIGLVVGSRKAGKESKVARSITTEGLGEQGQDLRQALSIPGWIRPVHGWSHHVPAVRVLRAGVEQSLADILNQGLDTTGHS